MDKNKDCLRKRGYGKYDSFAHAKESSTRSLSPSLSQVCLQKILIDRTVNIDIIRETTDIVKEYMIKNRLILYGGQAIDAALRLYGVYLYEEYEIPDYDFYSPNNVIDVYNMFKILVDKGYNPLAAMPAYHPETMRLRIFEDTYIADSTIKSGSIYHLYRKTSLIYDGLYVIHPYIQFADQHRALGFPFELVGASPTILYRYKKDFTRFKLLLSKYSIDVNDKITIKFLGKIKYPLDTLTMRPYGKGTTLKYDSKKIISGINAFIIYELIREGKLTKKNLEKKSTLLNSCVVEEVPKKFKSKRELSDVITIYTIDSLNEECVNMHKIGYNTINVEGLSLRVVTASYLIQYFYNLFIKSYEPKVVKNPEYLSAYLNLIKWTGEAFNSEDEKTFNNMQHFIPSIQIIGKEMPNKLVELSKTDKKLSNSLRPLAFYYRDGDDKEAIYKSMPKSFKYDPHYFT